MKIKTQDLIDTALDFAVAKAHGENPVIENGVVYSFKTVAHREYKFVWEPSTNWGQGGPIIERESIRLTPDQGDTYVECVWFAGSANDNGDEFNGEGVTPLIAAMRCYVASKLGDEVDVPDEVAA